VGTLNLIYFGSTRETKFFRVSFKDFLFYAKLSFFIFKNKPGGFAQPPRNSRLRTNPVGERGVDASGMRFLDLICYCAFKGMMRLMSMCSKVGTLER
jgi:hypothetical protein